MKTSTALLGCMLGICALAPVRGQSLSYDQFAPKPVPPTPRTASDVPPASINIKGNSGQVLLPRLRSLVFIGSAADIQPDGAQASLPIVIKNVDVPAEAQFRATVTPFLGRKLTRGDLSNLITAIIVHYRRHDHPVVDVVVPQQEITGGVVQILLLESRAGTITVSGNHWFSSPEIQQNFETETGDRILASRIKADLTFANQNPFHTTDVIYTPGHDTGVTDIQLQTRDRFPARFYLGYEDSGNAETGFDRYIAGVNWGDAWDAGLGHQLNYQYTTSGNMRDLIAHSGSYIIPLPWWHHTLTFFGDYIQTEGHLPPLISVQGLTYQASMRYTMPLPDLGDFKSSFGLGFDYKFNRNGLEFGAIQITPTPYEVLQFVMTYDASMHDPYGVTNFDAQIFVSPGDLTGENYDSDYNAQHTGATSSYAYSTLEMTRLTRLPGDFSLFLRGLGQFSNSNLTPSEQLGFGGYDTVRGYDEREINADEGFITNVELRTPTVSLGDALNWKGLNDQLQFLLFWDYGSSYNHHLLPGEPAEIPLSSLGGGLRYTINTYVSVRADWASSFCHPALIRIMAAGAISELWSVTRTQRRA